MKRFHAILAAAAVLSFGGGTLFTPAVAAPPTVTPSPGYDARLAEQRAAGSAPMTPQHKAFHRRTSKPVGHGY
jgi:hypothetical protein